MNINIISFRVFNPKTNMFVPACNEKEATLLYIKYNSTGVQRLYYNQRINRYLWVNGDPKY